MDRLIDEIVKVRVSDAAASATAAQVNTVAVVGIPTKTDAATSIQYSQDGVRAAYDDGYTTAPKTAEKSGLSKMSEAFFLERNPGRLVCIPVTAAPTGEDIGSTLDEALESGNDFYHVILRSDSKDKDTIVALVGALQDWCGTNFRLAHLELTDRATASAALEELAKDAAKTFDRVAVYFHSETNGRSLAAALVANRCASDPARGTWALKSLTSVSADSFTLSNFKDAQTKSMNIYAVAGGVANTFWGSTGAQSDTADGETAPSHFIDERIKKDWLKFRTQEKIFDLLRQSNNGDGLDYNDAGIAGVEAAITNLFSIAADNEHRYVRDGSVEISVPKFDEIDKKNRKIRNLPKVRVQFEVLASIHTVKTVELQVVA